MAALDKIYLSGVGYDLQDVKAPETWVTTAATVGSGDYSGVRLYEKRRGSGSTLYNNFEMMFANINGTSVLGSNSFSLQPTLSAGTGIDITNNVISVTGGGGGGGSNVVELTQAQYDALATKDPDTFYIITDATEIDASSFYTTAQTSSSTQIATALSGKQNTLTAGTGIDISNDVISVTGGGGGGTIDAALDANSPNAVANSAITAGFNGYTCQKNYDNGEVRYFYFPTPSYPYGHRNSISNFSINGRCPLTQTNGTNSYIDKFSLVETSAITTTLDSSSTDSQVPSAKAVYDIVGNINALLSAI